MGKHHVSDYVYHYTTALYKNEEAHYSFCRVHFNTIYKQLETNKAGVSHY